MKENIVFEASKNDLLRHLTTVSKVVSSRSNLPALTFVLVEITAGRIKLTGNNQETQIESSFELISTSGEMSFCIEKDIIEVLKTLAEQPVCFEVEREIDKKEVKVHIKINHSSGELMLQGLPGDDYVKMPALIDPTCDFPAANLKRGFGKTKKFIGSDELRPIFSSVYIDTYDDKVVFAATDTFGLSRFIDYSLKNISFKSACIPIGAVNIIYSLLEDSSEEIVSIGNSNVNIYFTLDCTTVICRQVEGRFPNYNSVIPSESIIHITLDSKLLSKTIDRLIKFADPSSTLLRLDTKDNIISLSAEDISYNKSGNETIATSCDGNISIGFKGIKARDILSVIDNNVKIGLTDPSRPILFQPEDQEEDTELSIIMLPLMLTRS